MRICSQSPEEVLAMADGTEAALDRSAREVVAGFTSDRLGSAATVATNTHSHWRAGSWFVAADLDLGDASTGSSLQKPGGTVATAILEV